MCSPGGSSSALLLQLLLGLDLELSKLTVRCPALYKRIAVARTALIPFAHLDRHQYAHQRLRLIAHVNSRADVATFDMQLAHQDAAGHRIDPEAPLRRQILLAVGPNHRVRLSF